MTPLKTVSRLSSFIFLFQHSMYVLNIIHLLQVILPKGSFPFQTGFTVYTFNKNRAKETTNIHITYIYYKTAMVYNNHKYYNYQYP
jgi:hypothetical protein